MYIGFEQASLSFFFSFPSFLKVHIVARFIINPFSFTIQINYHDKGSVEGDENNIYNVSGSNTVGTISSRPLFT